MNAERNQITISLGNENYWLSIVEFKSDDYHAKELALVHKSPADFFGISLVPLIDWYDDFCAPREETVNLLLGRETEEVVLYKAIVRAKQYLDCFLGLELDSEENL